VSRVGNLPIPIPDGVQVEVSGSAVKVKGPKGELEKTFHPDMQIELVGGEVVVSRPTDQRQHKALHGLTRSLINNMVIGVNEGFSKTLDVFGVGYRALLHGENLVLQLGHSHAVEVVPPPGVTFSVAPGDRTDRSLVGSVIVEGIDKQVVGQVAADIRAWRPPEPYKGKGVRYRGEYVRRKAGKAGKVG
jgi:large subunit ribosomal protein L6